MIFSSDIFPFFPTNPLKRIPLTITNMNTYKAKLEDTTPNVMSVIWTVSVQKQVYSPESPQTLAAVIAAFALLPFVLFLLSVSSFR